MKLGDIIETTYDVAPTTPRVESDVAQEIAKTLYHAAESQAMDTAHDESGHGFSGDSVMVHAQKILQRAMTYLDDMIKQGK